jgi:hypothetical protein
VFNGIAHYSIRADDTHQTVRTSPDDSYYGDADDGEGCPNDDGDADDYFYTQGCPTQVDPWIPAFTPLNPVPTYQEIIDATNANEALFEANIATANQALETYLRQCIVNGTLNEQQVATLVESIKQVYVAFVRQSAFLAYAKAQRLQDEAEYQAYQAQIQALQATIQQTAQQIANLWLAVGASSASVANALAATQTAAAAITATQAQIAEVNAQIAALLALLATDQYGTN